MSIHMRHLVSEKFNLGRSLNSRLIYNFFNFLSDVVLFHNHCRIAEEKALFEFTHPNRAGIANNLLIK